MGGTVRFLIEIGAGATEEIGQRTRMHLYQNDVWASDFLQVRGASGWGADARSGFGL